MGEKGRTGSGGGGGVLALVETLLGEECRATQLADVGGNILVPGHFEV